MIIPKMRYDALVIGGSYAGLSAAIYIARGRHSVCVVDAGSPRNRFSGAAHGFFGQDGARPAEMIRTARKQLAQYPAVTFIDELATEVYSAPEEFTVTLMSGRKLAATKIVLAFGVCDMLPDVCGVLELWGKSVLHCPYCHGYEFADRQLGVLGMRPMSVHQAQLIANWGPTTLFLNGNVELDDIGRAKLEDSGVTIEATPVVELEGTAPRLEAARLADNRRIALDALFIMAPVRPGSAIAERLGCAFDDGPLGPLIRVDQAMMTTVPGVYAAGDVMRPYNSATYAAADGVAAGSAVSQSLIFSALKVRPQSSRSARPT